MNAPEKILDRRTFLGSSDMAAVVGVSPWPGRSGAEAMRTYSAGLRLARAA